MILMIQLTTAEAKKGRTQSNQTLKDDLLGLFTSSTGSPVSHHEKKEILCVLLIMNFSHVT